MGQARVLKGNSVLQLLPSHLFTVIPAQVRFRIPALQGLRHNNAWHLASLLLLELITTVGMSVVLLMVGGGKKGAFKWVKKTWRKVPTRTFQMSRF